jgi:hypothetical protein
LDNSANNTLPTTQMGQFFLCITLSIAVALIGEIHLSAAHSISDESNLAHGH